jgi:hypothetical protein
MRPEHLIVRTAGRMEGILLGNDAGPKSVNDGVNLVSG